MQCTQIKPSTIWSESFDRAIREKAMTMMMTMEMVVMTTMIIMIDDDDKHTCESAIGVRRGEDELI